MVNEHTVNMADGGIHSSLLFWPAELRYDLPASYKFHKKKSVSSCELHQLQCVQWTNNKNPACFVKCFIFYSHMQT